MLPYLLLFMIPAWMAMTRLRPVTLQLNEDHWPGVWWWIFAGLVLMIGLRYEVGCDWQSYMGHIEIARYLTLQEVLLSSEPGYVLLNWLGVQTGWELYLTDFICAVFFSYGLIVFCRAQPRPWLALTVAVPYLIIVGGMGYTRQGVAIGLAMLGLVALSKGKVLRFVLLIAFAATFHKTAVILVSLAILANSKRRLLTVLWVGIAAWVLFILMLQEHLETLSQGYLETQYASQGALVRVLMNAFPALLFLLCNNKFEMPKTDRNFWIWMSLGALVFVGLLAVVSSSTAVDRVALYWIPLQLYVLSRLPNALGQRGGKNVFLVSAVVGYSLVVLMVWLVFSPYSHCWVPYQFYPWVWLWQ